MFEVGRLCVKTAGRDSNCKCVVIDVLDEKYVLVDGQTRRKKANVAHLEPLNEVLKVKKNESHEAIVKLFAEKGFKIAEKGKKEKKATVRMQKANVAKAKEKAAAKPKKEAKASAEKSKAAKKETKK